MITDIGDNLVINFLAKKVAVTGTIEEKGKMKIITVKSFKVVPEKNEYSSVLSPLRSRLLISRKVFLSGSIFQSFL